MRSARGGNAGGKRCTRRGSSEGQWPSGRWVALCPLSLFLHYVFAYRLVCSLAYTYCNQAQRGAAGLCAAPSASLSLSAALCFLSFILPTTCCTSLLAFRCSLSLSLSPSFAIAAVAARRLLCTRSKAPAFASFGRPLLSPSKVCSHSPPPSLSISLPLPFPLRSLRSLFLYRPSLRLHPPSALLFHCLGPVLTPRAHRDCFLTSTQRLSPLLRRPLATMDSTGDQRPQRILDIHSESRDENDNERTQERNWKGKETSQRNSVFSRSLFLSVPPLCARSESLCRILCSAPERPLSGRTQSRGSERRAEKRERRRPFSSPPPLSLSTFAAFCGKYTHTQTHIYTCAAHIAHTANTHTHAHTHSLSAAHLKSLAAPSSLPTPLPSTPALREVLHPERRLELEQEFASVPAFRPKNDDIPHNVAHLNRCTRSLVLLKAGKGGQGGSVCPALRSGPRAPAGARRVQPQETASQRAALRCRRSACHAAAPHHPLDATHPPDKDVLPIKETRVLLKRRGTDETSEVRKASRYRAPRASCLPFVTHLSSRPRPPHAVHQRQLCVGLRRREEALHCGAGPENQHHRPLLVRGPVRCAVSRRVAPGPMARPSNATRHPASRQGDAVGAERQYHCDDDRARGGWARQVRALLAL